METAVRVRQKPREHSSAPGLLIARTFEEAEHLIANNVQRTSIAIAETQRSTDASLLESASAALEAGEGPRPPRPYESNAQCLVIVPVYNEAVNLRRLITAIRAYLKTDLLIVDDNSPDGTGRIADEIARETGGVHVLHRPSKLGLGSAYVDGFRFALEQQYDLVFEMDADFSHAPWDLPRLAFAARDADLVMGSRYVRGGSTIGWAAHRRWLSRAANLYARVLLGSRVNDVTAGFRCYRSSLLAELDFSGPTAQGYGFQVEMVWRSQQRGARIREIPVHFVDREKGKSKMDARTVWEAALLVPALRLGLR